MQTVHPFSSLVNPLAWVAVDQAADGLYVWVINRTGGRLGRTGSERFATFDDAASAALSIAEAKGLPLAADVSIFIEMASPWYSAREMEEVAL